MLRRAKPLLSASARGLSRPGAPVSAAIPHRYASTAATTGAHRPLVPGPVSSRTLLPLMQRAQFAAKNERDAKFEDEIAKKKLKKDPEHVTTESSVRQFEPPGVKAAESSTSDSLVGDLNRVAEAIDLKSVPPLSYTLGFAGTIPYFATSLATVFLSWNLNTTWPSQSQFLNHFLMSHEAAAHYLHLLEPIQVGYGAVIISFLGAIHWGLEYAEKHVDINRSRFRYGLGVLAPVIAWPTVMLPVQFALTAQFAAFTFMYFMDTRAGVRGWTPQWYSTYRFVLTFIVGSALLISLIGREKVGADKPRLTGLREKFHKEGHDTMAQHQWEREEVKEKEKIHKQKAEEEKKKKAEEEKAKKEEAKKPKSEKKDGKQGGEEKKSKDDSKDEKKDEKKSDAGEEKTDKDIVDNKEDGDDKKEGGEEKQSKNEDKDEKKEDKSS
ncbi:hypothetical protein BD289DRAFT_384407 [Coniella lustricola]|uniref:Mitochondrial inner membrane protein 1 n=1 Tax=Coniella lustricola TaxID=2025994 RepID=A0A2T3AGM5_9PEZI|nr:hypothetical protein BD289DRAFT_384407 [Coniella lustricola]